MIYIYNILSLIFYKFGYFLITPKTYSFGGLYLSLFYGIKFCNSRKKKHLLVIGLINLHEKNFLKIYNIDLILKIFLKYSFKEKFLSIILSLVLNINLLILLILRKIRLWKFFSRYIIFLFPDYIGYGNKDDEIFESKNDIYVNKHKEDFFLKKLILNSIYSFLIKKLIYPICI